MSLRACAALLVLCCAMAAAPRAARADRPTSPPRLVDGCKRDPQSSLCREVRRLCATRAVRDDVAGACKELGWYGDTKYREIVNLCPIDPTHADCESTKQLCESQKASAIGEDGEKICREMGWGAYAYTKMEGAEEPPAEDGGGGDEREATSPALPTIVTAPPAGAEAASARHGGFAAWAAGVQALGVRLGLVDDAARVGGHDALYTAHLDTIVFSFARAPAAAEIVGDLGVAASSDVVYQADVLVGPGRWWSEHVALGLLGGVGVSGIGGGATPFAIDLPVRLVGVAHAGDRVTLQGWAQVEWFASTEDSRLGGAPSLGFVDAAELGGALVWGRRGAASGPFGVGLWLGGLYQEQNGTRIVSVMVGLGAARNPWNP